MLLKDKVALITGAGRGLGRAVALKFAEEGANLLLWSRDKKNLESARSEAGKKGIVAVAECVDMSNVTEIRKKFENGMKEFGGVAILVNCAGAPLLSKFTETTEEQYDAIFGVNMKGAFFLTQAVAKQMVAKQIKGNIVNISSVTAKTSGPLISAYSASKAALLGMTRSLSIELAPHGIRVNAICPGAMDTDMFHRDTLSVLAEMHNSSHEKMLKSMINMIPLKRIIDPKEVADFIAYLVSDSAQCITGQAINLSCGLEVH